MQSKRGGLVSIGEVGGGLDGPVKDRREALPRAVHHFTLSDQVNQLVGGVMLIRPDHTHTYPNSRNPQSSPPRLDFIDFQKCSPCCTAWTPPPWTIRRWSDFCEGTT